MPSPGGVEFGGILRLILDRVNGARRWPCGARLGDVGGEPEVSQDSLDHRRLVNQRHEPQPPPAAARSKSASMPAKWCRRYRSKAWRGARVRIPLSARSFARDFGIRVTGHDARLVTRQQLTYLSLATTSLRIFATMCI